MNVIKQYYQAIEDSRENWPCRTNRASMLGDPCLRKLVYKRTRHEEARLHDVGLQLIFNEGNLHGDAVIADLRKAGIRVLQQETALDWKKYNITGHIDGVIIDKVENDKGFEVSYVVPVEFKSMSPHGWSAIAKRGPGVYEWEEVQGAFMDSPYYCKYYGQLQLYLLLKENERGMFILKNKSTGALAQVNVELDYEYAESMLTKAEAIEAHIKAETLPGRLPFDNKFCSPGCEFFETCLPDVEGDPIAFLDDSVVEALCGNRQEAAMSRAIYEGCDKQIKAFAKARKENKILIGNWMITKKTAKNGAVSVKIERVEK